MSDIWKKQIYRAVCSDNDKAATLLWLIGRRYTDFSLYCEPGCRPEYELILKVLEAHKGWMLVEDQKYKSPQAKRADLRYLAAYWIAYMLALNVQAVGLCRGFREDGPGRVWSSSWHDATWWDNQGSYLTIENHDNRLSVYMAPPNYKLIVCFRMKGDQPPTDKFEMLVEYLETQGYANADLGLKFAG